MKHTANGIRVHKLSTGCEGTMVLSVQDKGKLGKFEIFHCNGTHTRGKFTGLKCTYVGRGKKLTEEDIKKLAEKAAKTAAKARQKQETIAHLAGSEEITESDAPVAELNESETTNKESETE